MSNLNLTQTDLNESLRGLTAVDIMMFLPDKGISFPSNAVTVNSTPLQYTTNLQSLLEFTSLPQANLATFENNSWILDGSFISPAMAYGGGGDSYIGYISSDMTDDNGDFTTNPILTITLAAAKNLEYLSVKFARGIDTSYPKTFKIRTYDSLDTLIQEHVYDMSLQTGLPLLVAELRDDHVKKVELEFVGTQCPHRRSRLDKIMFGRVEQINNYYLQSWKVDDKASLVVDSIPTKTLEYSVIDYEGAYDIDNANNRIPSNYKDVQILFTIYMEQDGLWKYAPTKVFNLIDISTSTDSIVTFSCGSILDVLTETYDHDIYTGPKTITEIMNALLAFSDIGTDQCVLNNFGSYKINVPLPEAPVRELIQRLALSCGATLLVDDNNKIIFTKKNILDTTYSSKFMFHQPEPFNSAGVLLAEPHVEALANTTDIAMYTYDSKVEDEITEVGTANITTVRPTKITFSPVEGVAEFDRQAIEDQDATLALVQETFSQHAIITVTWPDEVEGPIEVKVYGRKVETTKSISKKYDIDSTLLLDSGLTLVVPENLDPRLVTDVDSNTFYYTDWYGAKFKYICKTRNEYLVRAGDIILFETPYSNGQPTRRGYVLRNSYSISEDSGEMEVIVLDK